MEINQIKEQLSLVTVLNYYGIAINKNNHVKCPFHKDDKPSLRIYPDTNSYHFFGCGKIGDVRQFIKDFENSIKYEVLKKAKELIGAAEIKPIKTTTEIQEKINYSEIFQKFKQSLYRIKLAQGYKNGTKWKRFFNYLVWFNTSRIVI